MSDPITKAFNAVKNLDSIDYIIDRKHEGISKVGLKKFFFFDNSLTAYRQIAGDSATHIDAKKLDGEKTLAKLRTFEKVWNKYGKACVEHRDDPKVKKIAEKLLKLGEEIKDIDSVKAIVEVNEKDRKAFSILEKAIIQLENVEATEKRSAKKINFSHVVGVYKDNLEDAGKKISAFLEQMEKKPLSAEDQEKCISLCEQYGKEIEEFDSFLKKDNAVHSKTTLAKHDAFLGEARAFIKKAKGRRENLHKFNELQQKLNEAQRELSAVSQLLSDKRKEREQWNPPERYARQTRTDLEGHRHRIELKLEDYRKNIESESGDIKKLLDEQKELFSSYAEVGDLLSDARNSKIEALDKEIAQLLIQKDSRLSYKNQIDTEVSNFSLGLKWLKSKE